MIRYAATPMFLLGLLVFTAAWPSLEAATPPRESRQTFSAIALWSAVALASVCWWQMQTLSRTYARALQELTTQSERRESEELSLAAEAMQRYAIFMLDPKGYVASWDRDAQRLLGYTADEVKSRHVSFIYGEADARQGKPTHDLTLATTDGRADDQWSITRKDGFRFQASVVAIRDPSGELCGFTSVIREDA